MFVRFVRFQSGNMILATDGQMAYTKSFVNLLVTAARRHSLAADSATPVRRAGGNAAEDRNGVRAPYCEVDRWKDHRVCRTGCRGFESCSRN